MSSEIGRLLGQRYRIVAPVGHGPTAQVFLATDTELKRQVAVKLLHAELSGDERFLRMFQRELQRAAGLTHPHIVDVYDWGQDGSEHYLVTEFLEGGSLQRMLDDGWLLSPSQALQIGLEGSRALAYAAERGLVHGDLKPSNLLFTADGRLRVADFGLAGALDQAGWAQPEESLVAARYAAPERFDDREPGPESDVYSLAMVLTEAVAGDVPEAGPDGSSVPVAPDDLDALGPAFEDAWVDDAGQRLDARGLESELLEAAQHLPPPGPLPLIGALPDGAEPGDGAAETAAAAGASDGGDGSGAHGPVFVPAPTPEEQPEEAPLPYVEEKAPSRRSGTLVGALIVAVVLLVVGGGVFLLQRTGSGVNKVPELTGLQLGQAKDRVAPYGWEIKEIHTRRDFTRPGQVLRTSPKPGFKLRKGRQLILTVSDGNTLAPVPPELVGKPRAEAEQALMDISLVPKITTQFDEEVPQDVVIALGPNTPAEVPKGETVTMVVSDGPAPRKVPQGLVGIPVEDAIEKLDEVQLTADRVDEYNDAGVPAGQVIAIEPGPDTEVPRDSAVELTVSRGPTPKEVPDLRGSSVDQAAAQLGQLGFRVTRAPDQASDVYPTGQVISTDPAAGTSLGEGSVVTITVSSGPALVSVPSVTGLTTAQEASDALAAAGLTPGSLIGPTGGRPVATDPGAGSRVPRGSRVDIVLEASTTPPPPTSAPTTTSAPPTTTSTPTSTPATTTPAPPPSPPTAPVTPPSSAAPPIPAG